MEPWCLIGEDGCFPLVVGHGCPGSQLESGDVIRPEVAGPSRQTVFSARPRGGDVCDGVVDRWCCAFEDS